MSLKHIFVLGLVFILAACQAPAVATPGPTPTAIRVFFFFFLQPWADKLASCAFGIKPVALYLFPSASPSDNLGPDDILLTLGQPGETAQGAYPAQIGWEQIVVIANRANPQAQLTSERLRQIFSGQVTEWDDGSHQAIQVWVLPQDEPTRQIFDAALDLSQPLAAETRLAPDPAAMLEAISKDAGALGYLPESYLPLPGSSARDGIKIVALEQPLEQALRQPVLALTQADPTGFMRELIVCAQNSGTH